MHITQVASFRRHTKIPLLGLANMYQSHCHAQEMHITHNVRSRKGALLTKLSSGKYIIHNARSRKHTSVGFMKQSSLALHVRRSACHSYCWLQQSPVTHIACFRKHSSEHPHQTTIYREYLCRQHHNPIQTNLQDHFPCIHLYKDCQRTEG